MLPTKPEFGEIYSMILDEGRLFTSHSRNVTTIQVSMANHLIHIYYSTRIKVCCVRDDAQMMSAVWGERVPKKLTKGSEVVT